ncbi:MAG: CAP domain-containing protein [Desulfuromonas sp.]
MESRITDQINQIRAEKHLNKLEPSPNIARVARQYARRMVIEDFFSHYGPSGDSVADRVKEAGLDYRMVGENIFGSYNLDDPAAAAVNKWMQSPGHRKNILTPEFTQTGVGIWKEGSRYRFVQVFLQPAR